MRGPFLLLLTAFLAYCNALECGLKKNNGDKLKEALTFCVKDNQTLQSILDMAMSSESESTSLEEMPMIKVAVSSTPKPNAKGRRIKRARQLKKLEPDQSKGKNKEDTMSSTTEQPSTTTEDNALDASTQATEASSEMCLLQCVFEKMEMTDSDGFPDQSKLAEGLMKNASGKQVRDFLQDSTDECFQQADSEDAQDNCAYASKLVTCLADKGKSNCADWPAGNLPF